MKPFTLKLFKPDEDNRDALVRHYSEQWGRKAALAEILRMLMAEKVAAITKAEGAKTLRETAEAS